YASLPPVIDQRYHAVGVPTSVVRRSTEFVPDDELSNSGRGTASGFVARSQPTTRTFGGSKTAATCSNEVSWISSSHGSGPLVWCTASNRSFGPIPIGFRYTLSGSLETAD